MDIYNIGWLWFTPTTGISRMISGVSHLSFTDTFYFIFPILSFLPPRSNNIYHILYYMMFEIHRHQPFNQCFFFFGCVANTFIKWSIWSFRIINTLITVLMIRSILIVFVIIIDIFMSSTFSIELSWLVCDVSSLSVCEVSLVSGLSSFYSRKKWRYVWCR